MQISVGCSGHRSQGYIAQWLEQLTADQHMSLVQFRLEVMVYFRELFRQSNESDISDVQQHEPDYKKFS